jgi:hypothetical protein
MALPLSHVLGAFTWVVILPDMLVRIAYPVDGATAGAACAALPAR